MYRRRPVAPKLSFPRRRPRPEPAPAPTPPSALIRLLGFFESSKKVYLAIVTTLGALAFAILFAMSQRPSIVVGKFSLSEEAKKAGYDDLALSRQLANSIAEVIRAPSSRKDHRAIYSYDNEPTIDLEASDWSLKAMRQVLARLGAKRRYVVTGELLSTGAGQAKMMVRVEDSRDFAAQDSLVEVDKLMLASAEYIVKTAEPYLYAAYALSKGRDTEALGQIRFCLTHPPVEDDSWAYNLWGVYFLEKGRFAEASERFKSALAIDPRLAAAHFNLAQSLEGEGKVAEAQASYHRAEALWHAPEVLVGQAELLRKQSRHEEALTLFTVAVRDFPKDVEARTGMALTYLALDQPNLALPHAQFARDLSDFDIRVERVFAAVVDRMGRRGEAIAAYQRIVDHDPVDELARRRLAVLQLATKR